MVSKAALRSRSMGTDAEPWSDVIKRATGAGGMNGEEAPGKSPEEMYIQQKVRVLLMLKKMGSNLTPSEEAFLWNYAGVVHAQMSQLPQHNMDQGAEDVVMAFSRQETEDRRQ
ncbi:beta-catenin-interacting protein 1-like isoform X1 [Coregonus clupeaformis]|uniref:beta-catenin-interacting protein 1-like isoform X1 n=2 Tax=Coregonus clupeaformis TaxID=59861 RepID=UPI001BE0BF2F|nr:beta-catenin-interacting protein 1-like isoform X1 [Coregonus clupeaformis]